MAVYESEQEQLEEIKKWWKENGTSVVTGVVLGLAILFGWKSWEDYTHGRAEQASSFYEQVLINLEQGKADQARQIANSLLSEQSNSPYASLAQLNLAAQDLKEGNLDSSHARLQWVMDRNSLPQITPVARLRKVKLFLSQGKLDEAKKLLNSVADKGRFKASYTVLQGDIAMAQNQPEEARVAYTEALQNDILAGGEGLFSREEKNLVQMKLDNLGAIKATRIEASLPVSLPSDATATPSTANKNVLTVPASTSKAATTITPSTGQKQEGKPVLKSTPEVSTSNESKSTSATPKELPATSATTDTSTSGSSVTTRTTAPVSSSPHGPAIPSAPPQAVQPTPPGPQPLPPTHP